MKLKYQFELMDMDDMVVAVPVGENASEFSGVVRLNASAAEIFKLLQNDTTEEAIIAELKKQYSNDGNQIGAFVHNQIESLRKEALLA